MRKLENLVLGGLAAVGIMTGSANAARQTESYNEYRAGIQVIDKNKPDPRRDYYFNPSMTDNEVMERVDISLRDLVSKYEIKPEENKATEGIMNHLREEGYAVDRALQKYK